MGRHPAGLTVWSKAIVRSKAKENFERTLIETINPCLNERKPASIRNNVFDRANLASPLTHHKSDRLTASFPIVVEPFT